MTDTPPPRTTPNPDCRVNFFRPRPGYMRQKVRYIWLPLSSWAFFTLVFQFLLLTQETPAGDSPITTTIVFGFPLHYWFSGQFLIVWFILICLLYWSAPAYATLARIAQGSAEAAADPARARAAAFRPRKCTIPESKKSKI